MFHFPSHVVEGIVPAFVEAEAIESLTKADQQARAVISLLLIGDKFNMFAACWNAYCNMTD